MKAVIKKWWTRNDHFEFSFKKFFYHVSMDLIKFIVLFLVFLYLPMYLSPDRTFGYASTYNALGAEAKTASFYLISIVYMPFVMLHIWNMFDRCYVPKSSLTKSAARAEGYPPSRVH